MTQWRKDLQGRGPLETFSGSGIQPMGNGIQFALSITRQVRAFWQRLAKQPMGVLVCPPLPRALGIGKKYPEGESLRQALVFGHLFSPIIGQRLAKRGRHMLQRSDKSLWALPASVPSSRARITRRDRRSTRLPTADPFRAPLIKSPSQWPGTVRPATSAGRSAMGVILGSWPRRSLPRARGRRALRA